MKKPTKEEIKTARNVLKYYMPKVFKLADLAETEDTSMWAEAFETCVDLLRGDPEKMFNEYLEEYKAGR